MNGILLFAEATTAAESTGGGDLFGALGIDWRLLILQAVAFLVLVWLLGKYVYPWLMKSVDQRQADLEATAKASHEAQTRLGEVKAEAEHLLAQARKQSQEIVSTAKTEAADLAMASETRARQTAERIASDAHDQLQKDVAAAKRDLYNETLKLVSLTTEKVVAKTHTPADDAELVAALLKESE